MTLWNPLNVFSGQSSTDEGHSVEGTSASYDPSRTGDPLGPPPGAPAIGFGDARVGGSAGPGDPRRNPIGFAPPELEPPSSPARFRTEISFRRHHELPRASALPLEPDDQTRPAWQSPEPVAPVASDVDVEAVASEPDKSTPFFRREISFRRKKAVDEAQIPAEADAGVLDDASPVVGETATEVEFEAPDDVAETMDVAETVDVSEPVGETIPFYKRELGFRRKKATSVIPGDTETKAADVEIEATAETVERTDEPEAMEAAEDVHVAEVFTLPSVAVDESPVEDAAELPVAEADPDVEADEPAVEVEGVVATDDRPTDAVDETGEDSHESTGRFSRKEKAPKRQRSGGSKSRKIVGLKIGASQIAAAVIAESESGHELVGLSRRPLAAGIVVDGEVRDEVALASAVKALFDEEKLPKTDVRLGLSSNRIGVRTLDVEGVEDESRFDNAVRFKAHEVLPVALSESLLDYRVLDERIGADGEATRRVLLVVAPRDQVAPYQRVASQAGIKLSVIDLEALGLLRAFVEPGSGLPAPDDTATVVIAIGHESSTLLVAGGGSCEFTRVFDWGGAALEEAIAASLEVRPAEAATILRHLSLSGPGRQYEVLTDETRAKATEAVRQRLTPFARELVNSLQFYQTQSESLGIGGILVTGGTSHLEGLDEALHQMIGVEVSIGDPFARVVRGADFDSAVEATIGSLAVSIGLAIEDLPTRGVNLLPKGEQSKKSSTRSTLMSIGIPVAAAVPLAALSFLYIGAHGKVADNQSELDAVKAEIATLPLPKTPVIDPGVPGDEAARATAVAQVLGGRLAWDAVFRDMARILPDNVWLSTLQLTQPTAQNLADGTGATAPADASTSPSAVTIDGFTYTQPDVARLLARLATLPSLQRVTLQSSQGELIATKPVVHFVIVADLSQTGGVS